MVKLRRVLPYLLLLCLLPSACQAAEKTYRITETELTRLETNLNRLQEITAESKNESEKQKAQLRILKNQLSEAENLLAKQRTSLQTANELLEKYAKEEQKSKRRLKRERLLWVSVAGVLLVRSVAR